MAAEDARAKQRKLRKLEQTERKARAEADKMDEKKMLKEIFISTRVKNATFNQRFEDIEARCFKMEERLDAMSQQQISRDEATESCASPSENELFDDCEKRIASFEKSVADADAKSADNVNTGSRRFCEAYTVARLHKAEVCQ